jgi:hypothetical protein
MKIADVRATTVTVPLEAPLRHANGCHWGRFVRTIVEIETDTGFVGLGEMGGGGESAIATVLALKGSLIGRDPARLEEMRSFSRIRPRRSTTIAPRSSPLWSSRASICSARRGVFQSPISSADEFGIECRLRRTCFIATPMRKARERYAPSNK